MTSKSELKRQNIMRDRPMMEGIETLTQIQTLKSLQQRIREATGPDPALDLAIARAFEQPTFRIYSTKEEVAKLYTTDPDGLGACVALMRTLFPGWMWTISEGNLETNGGRFFAYVHVPIGYTGPGPWPEGSCHHNNPCLALLYSIIAARIAVIAEEEAKEKADV